jgi:hypothetical protein
VKAEFAPLNKIFAPVCSRVYDYFANLKGSFLMDPVKTVDAIDPLLATRSKLMAVAKLQFPEALPDWLNQLITALIDAAMAWLASCGIVITPASINAACKTRSWKTYYLALRYVRSAYADSFGPGKFYANHGMQAVEVLLTAGATATAAELSPVIDLAATE